ncbi:MAG: type I restriction enzyme HsdR N-terminal domain-containing protein [Rhodocyclales bacterium]|nr:type I restriction enzyme HsdR N-terminal domain-containing protein [Rhodocyclales bacterium]
MTFNRYVWSLYRDSDRGREMINRAFPRFSRSGIGFGARPQPLSFSIAVFPEVDEGFKGKSQAAFFAPVRLLLDFVFRDSNTFAVAEDSFRELVNEGGFLEWDDDERSGKKLYASFGGKGYEGEITGAIGAISTFLHWRYSDWFVPYYFAHRYNRLAEICEAFDIPLPPIPGKLQAAARAMYYLTINRALQEFRDDNGLSPKELNALLYDFAPRYLETAVDNELPPPQRAWFIMAGVGTQEDFKFLDQANATSRSTWRGHRDARRGDIAVVWCSSPRACLHSVWRIVEDGFDDPLADWYSLVKIGHPLRVAPIKLADMKANPVLAGSPMIRACFQGSAGQYFRDQDYVALLEVLAGKGADVSALPRLDIRIEDHGRGLMNERDVEQHLIEPLLQRLGYADQDWTRQLRLRMGRGDRVFPDYVIGADLTFGQERGALVVEAKYRIATQNDLQEAWIQGRSYALRLEAKWLVLAALEGVWLLSAGNGFRLDGAAPSRWSDLDKPEIFFPIERSIGKKHLGKRKSA